MSDDDDSYAKESNFSKNEVKAKSTPAWSSIGSTVFGLRSALSEADQRLF